MATAYLVTAQKNPTGLGIALVDIYGHIVEILEPAELKSAGHLDSISEWNGMLNCLREIEDKFGVQFAGKTEDKQYLKFRIVNEDLAYSAVPFQLPKMVDEYIRASSSASIKRLLSTTKGVSINL